MAPKHEPEPLDLEHCQSAGDHSSRVSAACAGWSASKKAYQPALDQEPRKRHWVNDDANHGRWDERLRKIPDRRWRDFSWLTPLALLDSVNDQIAKLLHDLVNSRRHRWITAQRAAGVERRFPDFVVDKGPRGSRRGWKSLLVVGDPGEADGSQYAVVDPLRGVHERCKTDGMLILSDVIYPAGDVNDYVNGFYRPYEEYCQPILALPGNHDWYDGLNGFMFHFCGCEALPTTQFRAGSYTVPERLSRWLWRQASRPNRPELLSHRAQRQADKDAAWEPEQPGPYFALDMGPVRLVCIDTGIRGTLDRAQGEWLSRVSREPTKLKLLMTGKPLWVDGEFHPTPIEWGGDGLGPHGYETVDDMVRDPCNGYLGSIGGDIHNYQRYTVTVRDEPEGEGAPTRRRLEYIVSGGGGAYMSATHRFGAVDNSERESPQDREERLEVVRQSGIHDPKVSYKPPENVARVGEDQFRCYPVRGDSVAYYARWFGRRLFNACVISALIAGATVAGLLAWDGPHKEALRQDPFNLVLAAFGGLVVTAGVATALVMLAHRVPPHGYRTVSTLLAVPAGFVGIAAALVAWHPSWDWVWEPTVLALGTIAVPLAIVVVAYYGLGAKAPGPGATVPRDVAVAILVIAEATLFAWDAIKDISIPALVAVTLAAIAILTLVVRWASRRLRGIGRGVGEKPALASVLGVLTYAAFVVPVVWHLWDIEVIRVAVASAAMVWLLLTAVLWLVMIFSNGLPAFPFLANGRIDPDQAIAWIAQRYGTAETEQSRRFEPLSWRTRAICFFLVPPWPRSKRKWIPFGLFSSNFVVHGVISEVGNADRPPMFKNFLHLGLDDALTKLVVTCYGVTGWRLQDGIAGREIPVEDCVEFDLTLARADLAAALAGAEP